jgi:serine/threonine protein phosphatase 1
LTRQAIGKSIAATWRALRARASNAAAWTKSRLVGWAGSVQKLLARWSLSGPARRVAKLAEPEEASAPQLAAVSTAPEASVPDGVVVYAIGDIHGRCDLLENLLERLEEDAQSTEEPHLVFLGDYIDRGLQSRQVIEMLLALNERWPTATFLKGNHEEALLKFLDRPEYGPNWATYGGRETLVSYGVRPPRSFTMNEEWRIAHDDFIAKFPQDHLHFLRTLDVSKRIGGYGFVHAGVKPGRPFEEQSENDMLWIRDEFLTATGREDLVVVHGHTPVDHAYSDNRRINIDTGAYFSGRLTAVRLEGDTMRYISTR